MDEIKPPKILQEALEALRDPSSDPEGSAWEIVPLEINGQVEWCLAYSEKTPEGEKYLPLFRAMPPDAQVSAGGTEARELTEEVGTFEEAKTKAKPPEPEVQPIFSAVRVTEDDTTQTWINEVLEPELIGILIADVARHYSQAIKAEEEKGPEHLYLARIVESFGRELQVGTDNKPRPKPKGVH